MALHDDDLESVDQYVVNKNNPQKDNIKENVESSVKKYDVFPSLGSKSEATKPDNIMSNLRSMTKRMSSGDWIWLLGTLGLAMANPKGRGAQAKVIQHNLDESRKLGVATAKQALSRVRNTILPKLQQNEKDVIEMRSFMINNLKGVDPRIINNLALAGPMAFKKFMTDLNKINEDRAKFKSDGISNPQPKLTGDQINKLFVNLTDMEESPIDFGDTEESRRKAINELLDDTYSGYKDLLDAAETSQDLDYGLFGAAYGNPKSALKDAAQYLKRFGSFPVGNRMLDMSQLDKLSIADIGLDPNRMKSIEYDITRGRVDETDRRISKSLEGALKTFYLGTESALITDSMPKFRELSDSEDLSQKIWGGRISEIATDKNLDKIASAGKGIFTLLYNQALMEDIKNIDPQYKRSESIINAIREANQGFRSANQRGEEFVLDSILDQVNVNQNTVFASKEVAIIYAKIMKKQQALGDDFVIKYYETARNPSSSVVSETIAQLLSN